MLPPSNTFFVPRLTVALGGHLSYADMCSGPKDVSSQVKLYSGNRIIGTLSNYDDDGSANITKTINMRPFKLHRVYLEPLNSSNVADFSWTWILKAFIHVQIEKGKFVVVCPRPT